MIINAGRHIDIQGTLTADAQGYGPELGPGAGDENTSGSVGSGAGYGGEGGDHNYFVGAVGGGTYGSETAPTDFGSGGGDDEFGAQSPGTAGSGAVKLEVSGTLTVDGTIYANCETTSVEHEGAGSGGSVWLNSDTFAGSGTITAHGGDVRSGGYAGAGGGGCIAITYVTKTYSGTATATFSETQPTATTAMTVRFTRRQTRRHCTELTVTPASPSVSDSVFVETTAAFDSGIDRIERYLDGTDPGDLVHTCDPAGSYTLGSLGQEAYGLCVDSWTGPTGTQDGGDTFAGQAPYSSTCTSTTAVIGQLQGTPQDLLVASGPISAGRAEERLGIEVTSSSPAHPDYTDVLTFLATGTF